jgi:hypothetical protein
MTFFEVWTYLDVGICAASVAALFAAAFAD